MKETTTKEKKKVLRSDCKYYHGLRYRVVLRCNILALPFATYCLRIAALNRAINLRLLLLNVSSLSRALRSAGEQHTQTQKWRQHVKPFTAHHNKDKRWWRTEEERNLSSPRSARREGKKEKSGKKVSFPHNLQSLPPAVLVCRVDFSLSRKQNYIYIYMADNSEGLLSALFDENEVTVSAGCDPISFK